MSKKQRVYQIGNGKIYKSEKVFKNNYRHRRGDDKIRIYELVKTTTIDAMKAQRKRDKTLNKILNPNDNLEGFYAIIKRKRASIVGDDYHKRNQRARHTRLLDYDAEEIKNYLKGHPRDVMSLCESIEDFIAVFILHNYMKYSYKRIWDRDTRKYIPEPDGRDQMFLDAKEEFKKRKKKERIAKKKAELA